MHKRVPILLGLLLLIVAVWMQVTSIPFVENFITRVENLAYDMQLRTKILTHRHHFDSAVVIVDVDDQSIEAEGRWPWSRSKLGTITQNLQEAGAVVIVYDMFFAAPEKNIVTEILRALTQSNLANSILETNLKKIEPLFDNDAKFAAALKQSDTVIGLSFLPRVEASGVLPPPILQLKTPAAKKLGFIIAQGYIGEIPILNNAAKSIGFVNVFGDVDGIIRTVPVLIRYQNNVYPSLALEAVRLFLLSNIELVTESYGNSMRLEGVKLANHIIPTDAKAQVIVPFRGRSFTFKYYSATDVIHKKFPVDAFQGKIVFVGTSATGLGDLKATAIESSFPGVEIQATIADGILSDNFAYTPSWATGAEVFLSLFLGLIFVFSFPYMGPRFITLVIIVLPALLIVANNWLWEKTGLILSIFIPLFLTVILALLNMIYGYLFETRRREYLKEMFGQYVPAKHIDEMLSTKGSSYAMLGEDREMSVLFADVRNFTNIAEDLPAQQLKEMLDAYFTPMTEIIFKHHGTIDKYVGDLIMAFWGAPLKDKRHATRALTAALDMQKKLKELRPQLSALGWPEIHIGVGVNTGEMSVGDMGSKFRRNYTVLGDAVNLASRIESLTKYYGVEVMTTEFSKVHAEKTLVFRQLDKVRVKGKMEGIAIYEVVSKKLEITADLEQEVKESDEALNFYFNQEWDRAQALFENLKKSHGDFKFYDIYLARIAEFRESPPPKDWDGVYTMMSK